MFIVVKKFSLILICVSFVLSLAGIILMCRASNDEKIAFVVIDAGHGEPDGGATAPDGTKESDLNLAVCQKLDFTLCEKGYKTLMTRTDKNGIHKKNLKTTRQMKSSDMKKRAEIKTSSGADIFVSIHMNKFEQPQYYGAQVIYDSTNERAKILAREIQTKLNAADPKNTRTEMAANKNIYLLKSSAVPSVIVECGFLSNATELEKLKTEEYQTIISNAVCEGINNYFKLTKNS